MNTPVSAVSDSSYDGTAGIDEDLESHYNRADSGRRYNRADNGQIYSTSGSWDDEVFDTDMVNMQCTCSDLGTPFTSDDLFLAQGPPISNGTVTNGRYNGQIDLSSDDESDFIESNGQEGRHEQSVTNRALPDEGNRLTENMEPESRSVVRDSSDQLRVTDDGISNTNSQTDGGSGESYRGYSENRVMHSGEIDAITETDRLASDNVEQWDSSSGGEWEEDGPRADVNRLGASGAGVNMGDEVWGDQIVTSAADMHISDDGSTALIDAATVGNEEILLAEINSGADVNIMSYSGKTALCSAIKGGHEKCVEYLVKVGADVNWADRSGLEPIVLAVEKYNPKIIKSLLESRADVNARNVYGETVWQSVVENGLSECLIPFIKAGANVNYTAYGFEAPLIRFVTRRDLKSTEILIRLGADVNLKGNNGQPAIMEAAKQGDVEILRLLIAGGADVNVGSGYGLTVLMKAAQGGYHSCVKLLLEAGADVNARHNNGSTALMNACKTNMHPGAHYFERVNCVNLLISVGANVNSRTLQGHTALMYAAEQDSTEIVAILIKSGAKVNTVNDRGHTALMYAAISRNIKIGYFAQPFDYNICGIDTVKILLRCGAYINTVNFEGKNTLHFHLTECVGENEELNSGEGATVSDGVDTNGTIAGAVCPDPNPDSMEMLLFVAGETVNITHIFKDDPMGGNKTVLVPDLLRSVRPRVVVGDLKATCREFIRLHLLQISQTINLFHRIPMLGLPTVITRYLLFYVSLDTVKDYGIENVEFQHNTTDSSDEDFAENDSEESDEESDIYSGEDFTEEYTETEETGDDDNV